jgi:uncharacterized Fe-S cluster protein YjdI
MKVQVLAMSLFLSFICNVQAGDRTSAYNAICKPMPFETNRNECMAKVKLYNYFDNRALGICAALAFDSGKMSCLDLIGNKTYEGYEMDSCIHQTFESKKLECLQENGSIYQPNKPSCVPNQEAVEQLSNSLQDLRSGNLRAVDQRLSILLDHFNKCF